MAKKKSVNELYWESKKIDQIRREYEKYLAREEKDSDPDVRLVAACLLTELDDYSGVRELEAALAEFAKGELARVPYWSDHLIAALERLTGENLGSIPMSPFLHSSTARAANAEQQMELLLSRWWEWWQRCRRVRISILIV